MKTKLKLFIEIKLELTPQEIETFMELSKGFYLYEAFNECQVSLLENMSQQIKEQTKELK